MRRNKFSTEMLNVFNLMVEGTKAESIRDNSLSYAEYELNARNKLIDLLGGATDANEIRKQFRRNKIEIYDLVEEMADVIVGERVPQSPFIEQFVETKNRALGDTSDWTYELGDTAVSIRMAGNHWDVNRRKLHDYKANIHFESEWIALHLYDELERFLLGFADMNSFARAIQSGTNNYIKQRVYGLFQSMQNMIPTEYKVTGNTAEDVIKLIQLVQAVGGYGEMTIAGTALALRKLTKNEYTPTVTFAEDQKTALMNTGNIRMWNGYKLLEIPQQLKADSTTELALDDTKLFILGGNSKPIKLEIIGNTRVNEYNEYQSQDMTRGLIVESELAVGAIMPNAMGIVTLV